MLTTYGSVPLWIHRAGTAEAGFYGFLSGRWADDRGRLWPSVATMAEAVGKSIRTVERWIAKLKKIGALQVFRRRRRDGTLGTATYQLVWEDPSPELNNARSRPHDKFGTARTIPTVTSSTSVLRTGEQAREPVTAFDGELEMASKVSEGQLSFDLNIDDQLDSCTTPSDNGIKDRNECPKEGRGTAASRVMAWWISNRKVAPTPVQRLAMGGAIKQCLTSQIEPTDEQGVTEALRELMRSGTDTPMLLRRRFAIYPKRRKQRDYQKDPLFMHTPKPSMLKPQQPVTAPSTLPSEPELPDVAPRNDGLSIQELLQQSMPSQRRSLPDGRVDGVSLGEFASGLLARLGLPAGPQ